MLIICMTLFASRTIVYIIRRGTVVFYVFQLIFFLSPSFICFKLHSYRQLSTEKTHISLLAYSLSFSCLMKTLGLPPRAKEKTSKYFEHNKRCSFEDEIHGIRTGNSGRTFNT